MHRINITLVSFLIFTVVSSGLAYKIVMSAYGSYDYTDALSSLGISKSKNNTYKNLIKVSSPKESSKIESPLLVKGEARGSWYFEGSFPIRVFDANNKELGVVPAKAIGNWMTKEFVPFEAVLTFNKPNTKTGTLVLQKDNPSGDPDKDDSFSIPVRFQD